MTINKISARQFVSKITNVFPQASVWGLVIIGVLLVVHQFWLVIEISFHPLGGRSISHWFIMFGWTYLLVGVIGLGILNWEIWASSPLSLRRIFLISLLTIPVLAVLFQPGLLQPETNESFETILGFAFLIFPVIISFLIGIAIRTRDWQGVGKGCFIWSLSWVLSLIIEFNWINMFIFVLSLPHLMIVAVFTLPTFIAGLLVSPDLVSGHSSQGNMNCSQEPPSTATKREK